MIFAGRRWDDGASDDLAGGGAFRPVVAVESELELEPAAQTGATHRSVAEAMTETERLIRLITLDDLWSDYLAEIADYRAGIHLVSWSRDPLHEYLVTVDQTFTRLQRKIEKESDRRLREVMATGILPQQRGATWTYLTSDQPFGPATERILRGLVRMAGGKVL